MERTPEVCRGRIHRQQQIAAMHPLRLLEEIRSRWKVRPRLQQHKVDTACTQGRAQPQWMLLRERFPAVLQGLTRIIEVTPRLPDQAKRWSR